MISSIVSKGRTGNIIEKEFVLRTVTIAREIPVSEVLGSLIAHLPAKFAEQGRFNETKYIECM